MADILTYICTHADYAPWILFGLLLLTGFNIPISEDLIVMGGGVIAASCLPEHPFQLYLWIFFGCYLSAWEAYWIGRLLGPRLYTIRLFKSIITPARMEWLRSFYAKYGIFTFIVGRFFPGGVRNALFFSSGLTKMPFYLFILRDGFACILSSSTLFLIGYHFSKNFDLIRHTFEHYSYLFMLALLIILAGVLIYRYKWVKMR